MRNSKVKTAVTFSDRVLKLACSIPKGCVTTYGRIARAAGGGGMAAQSITSILSKAEASGVRSIPFHRIVYADGRIWTSPKWHPSRMKLYRAEAIRISADNRIENFSDILFEFK